MAKNSKEFRPAGEGDKEFEVSNINLAKSPDLEEAMRVEQGPEIKGTILSISLADGVSIPAKNGEIEAKTLR